MHIKYCLPEIDETLLYYIDHVEASQDKELYEIVAEDYYWERHGYEKTWPLTFKIWVVNVNGHSVRSCSVMYVPHPKFFLK